PDGASVMTGPDGLFSAFTDLNGRDYFHNSQGGYWRRVSANVTQTAGDEVRWQTQYDLLDASGNAVMTETERWSMRETNNAYLLSLEWRGHAKTDVTIGGTESTNQSAADPRSIDEKGGLF